MKQNRLSIAMAGALLSASMVSGCAHLLLQDVKTDPAVSAQRSRGAFDDTINQDSVAMREEGRKIFRFDTFGSEEFWGGTLQLHRAIIGEKEGGVGPGLTPRQALQVGLKVDVTALPAILGEVIRKGSISLDDPRTTQALIRANAVVGVRGDFDEHNRLRSVGITCAICHSTVDDSFAPGIGRRLDGWPNRDLNVGEVVALAPNLKPYATLLHVEEDEVRRVVRSWGPGKYDAELNFDGKATGPGGKSAAVLIPAAFGLAGMNNHTYTGGRGSIPYWNAYVAVTQMHGKGAFYDPRLEDAARYPLAPKTGLAHKRDSPDLVTSKLAALHLYQLSIPAPKPPEHSYNAEQARRGEGIFMGKAKCATCHIPPLFSEPGANVHRADEIGIDDFQAQRGPEATYRTMPLKGLFARSKGGFYHDGRFADYMAVVEHYDTFKQLKLTATEKEQLVEYLKTL
jgi:hypothetical protein